MPKQNSDDELYRKAKRSVAFKQTVAWFVIVNAICWAVYFIAGYREYMWPLWVTFGTGIALVSAYLSYASFSLFSVDDEYDRLKKKQK